MASNPGFNNNKIGPYQPNLTGQWQIQPYEPNQLGGPTPPLRQRDPFTRKAAPWTAVLPKGQVKAGAPIKPPDSAGQIRAMQQFLRNRGYNIAVDGVRGPETSAAVLAFHQHIAPGAFNSKRGGTSKMAPPSQVQYPDNSAPPGGSQTGRTAATASSAAQQTDPVQQKLLAALDTLLNPQKTAQGAVNAEYDPQIAALQQQINQGGAQAGQNQADIAAWNQQLQKLASDISSQTANFNSQAKSDYDTSAKNSLGELFGGSSAGGNDAAAEASAFHDIGDTQMASDNADDNVFNSRMDAILKATGTQDAYNQKNVDAQTAAGLASQLVSLKGAKGQAYSSALQNAIQARAQQASTAESAYLGSQLAPYQKQTAKAQADTAIADAATAPALAAAKLKTATAQAKAAQQQAGGTWNLNVPQQQGALQSALESNILGPNRGLTMDPQTAWTNLQTQLQEVGLGNNAQAQALAKGVFLNGIHTSHSRGSFGGYAWNGNKVVKTGNRYIQKGGKTVLVNAKGKVIPNYVPSA